jgi:hypothetical protein
MPYMEWAKTVMEGDLRDVIDAGSSGIASVTLRELGVALRDLALDGPHAYSAARRCTAPSPKTRGRTNRASCPRSAPRTRSRSSALADRAGDEVLVETPGYEALPLVPRASGAGSFRCPRRFENGFQIEPASCAVS